MGRPAGKAYFRPEYSIFINGLEDTISPLMILCPSNVTSTNGFSTSPWINILLDNCCCHDMLPADLHWDSFRIETNNRPVMIWY